MSGKGSKRRKENYNKFVNNYESINWTVARENPPKLTDKQVDELLQEVRKARACGKLKC